MWMGDWRAVPLPEGDDTLKYARENAERKKKRFSTTWEGSARRGAKTPLLVGLGTYLTLRKPSGRCSPHFHPTCCKGPGSSQVPLTALLQQSRSCRSVFKRAGQALCQVVASILSIGEGPRSHFVSRRPAVTLRALSLSNFHSHSLLLLLLRHPSSLFPSTKNPHPRIIIHRQH